VDDGKLSDLAVAILHGILGMLTCVLVARIAYLMSGSKAVAVIACLGVALDPILLKQSSLVMTETLATFMAVLLWWLWIELTKKLRSNWAFNLSMLFLGLLAGVGCLVRPTTFAWVAIWLVACFSIHALRRFKLLRTEPIEYASRQTSETAFFIAPPLLSYFSFLIGISLVVMPWAYRNASQIGQWTMTTTHGGYTLLLANNPVLYEQVQQYDWDRQWDEERFHRLWEYRYVSDPRTEEYWQGVDQPPDLLTRRQSMRFLYGDPNDHSEVRNDKLASEVAWRTIQRDPVTFLKSCVVRMGWFWAVVPFRSGATSKVAISIGIWYCLLFGGVLVGLIRVWKDKSFLLPGATTVGFWIPAISLLVSLMIVHSIYWSNMRMRAPIMPAIYVFWAVTVFRALRHDGKPMPVNDRSNQKMMK
jgi:hypothetical protein